MPQQRFLLWQKVLLLRHRRNVATMAVFRPLILRCTVMEQLEFFDIPSPCVGVCIANNRGYCKGCFRSRDERLYWLKLSDAQKREVVRLCAQRKRKVWLAKMHSLSTEGEHDGDVDAPELNLDFKDEQAE
jgi:predicted Fe-S protein YdhL (DUF1289 family)